MKRYLKGIVIGLVTGIILSSIGFSETIEKSTALIYLWNLK